MYCCSRKSSNKSKSLVSEPVALNPCTSDNAGVAKLKVEIEFSENLKFIIGDSDQNELNSSHTTSYLLSKAQALSSSEPVKQSGMKMIGLQTKNKNLHFDYLLSLPDYLLDFLPQYTVLVPYYATPLSFRNLGVTLGDFEIKAKLGEGGFSKVFLVRLKSDGRFYALKQMNKSTVNEEERQRMSREKDIMSEIESPLLLKLHYAFQTQHYCYLVSEFLPAGDLQRFLTKTQKLTEQQAKLLAAEVLLSIEALHAKRIIYRDLKIENVLVDINGQLKLADFGFARKLTDSRKFAGTICGTLSSASPEVLKSEKYDFRSDYYSLGVLIYELATYQPAFEAKDIEELLYKIAFTEPKYPQTMSKELKSLVSKLMCKDPEKRLGAKKGIQEIFKHPWFKGINFQAINLLMTEWPPRHQRIKERKTTLPIRKVSLITQDLPLLDENFLIEDRLEEGQFERADFGKKLSLFTYAAIDLKEGETYTEPKEKVPKSLKFRVNTLQEESNEQSEDLSKSTTNLNHENYSEEIDEIDMDHGDVTNNIRRFHLFCEIVKVKEEVQGSLIPN